MALQFVLNHLTTKVILRYKMISKLYLIEKEEITS